MLAEVVTVLNVNPGGRLPEVIWYVTLLIVPAIGVTEMVWLYVTPTVAGGNAPGVGTNLS
jgi:hypothetical protein